MLGGSAYAHWTVFGHIGVTYFFVLSGFIIAHAHAGDIGHKGRAIPYIKKRFIRIYPIYWAVILLLLLKVAVLGNSEAPLPHTPYSWFATILLLPQHAHLDPGADRLTGALFAPIDLVGWSLQYEVIFYAFFLILILNRNAGLILGTLALAMHFLGPSDMIFPLFLLELPFFLVFAFGIAAAWISRFHAPKAVSLLLGFLGLVMVALVSGREVGEYGADSIEASQLTLGAGFFLIILALVWLERQGTVIGKNPLLQQIGAASYSIYLIHGPAGHLSVKTFSKFPALHSFLPVLFVLLASLTLLVGIIVHKMIERPLMAASRNLLRLKPSPGAAD